MSSMLSGSRRLVGSPPRAGVSWPHRGPHCPGPFSRGVLSFLTRVGGQYPFRGGAGAAGAAPRGCSVRQRQAMETSASTHICPTGHCPPLPVW